MLPVWSLAGPRRRLRTTRRDGTVVRTPNRSWLRHLGAVAFLSAAAAVLGFLAARVVADETSPAWALLVVYAPLVAESVVLSRASIRRHRSRPRPCDEQPSVARQHEAGGDRGVDRGIEARAT